MEFIEVETGEAVGAIAAHSVRRGDLVIRKGKVVTAAQAETLAANGVQRIIVARLGPDDRHEDEVAHELALKAAGVHVRVADPFTGRANLFSEVNGVLRLDVALIDRFNAVDERITIATLPDHRVVQAGEMAATVKIIPFAVDRATVARARGYAAGLMSVAAFGGKKLGVISTLLPGLKPKTISKTLRALEDRIGIAGSSVTRETRVDHEGAALAKELRALAATDADILVVFGASAMTDRRDVVPAAIEEAGGRLIHVGMPVDPGNLLVLGELLGKPVIGAPGCARSPRENGFDWVLQRLLADIPVSREDIMRMGVGGLLMEIGARGQPRDPASPDQE